MISTQKESLYTWLESTKSILKFLSFCKYLYISLALSLEPFQLNCILDTVAELHFQITYVYSPKFINVIALLPWPVILYKSAYHGPTLS